MSTRIAQTGPQTLRITCAAPVDRREAALIRRQVARMLRCDESLESWHRLHRPARRVGFGRLFRSPTFFEDAVKTITACNVGWTSTIRMNRLLCDRVGSGAFPTARQVAALRPTSLRRSCKVGYRADRIVRLARRIDRGELDVSWFENAARTADELYGRLLTIHGIGPYAAANLCQSLGRYDRLAIDSETYRHFREFHSVKSGRGPRLDRRIQRHYEPYRPYQFLAYWFELWTDYQRRNGDARSWNVDEEGRRLTASPTVFSSAAASDAGDAGCCRASGSSA